MNEFNVKLNILQDILEKKKESLTGIINISENQETILANPPSLERSQFFAQTAAEKQKLIDNVLELDEMFQGFFDSVKDTLQNMAGNGIETHKQKILALQSLISEVMEIDVRIRAQELKNNSLRAPAPPSKNIDSLNYRKQILDKLNKHK